MLRSICKVKGLLELVALPLQAVIRGRLVPISSDLRCCGERDTYS